MYGPLWNLRTDRGEISPSTWEGSPGVIEGGKVMTKQDESLTVI